MEFDTPGKWIVGAGGLLLLGGIFSAIAMGSVWGTMEGNGVSADAELRDAVIHIPGFGSFPLSWDSDDWDDADGIEMVRAAGTLHLVGLISSFVAGGTVGLAFLVRGVQLPVLGGILAAIGAACLLTALVLFPIGVEQVLAWFEEEQGEDLGDMAWSGLAIPIIGTALALAGTVGAFITNRHDY